MVPPPRTTCPHIFTHNNMSRPSQCSCFIPNSSLLWRRTESDNHPHFISFIKLHRPSTPHRLPDTSCLLWPSGIPYLMKSQKLIRVAIIENTCPSKAGGHVSHGAERHFTAILHFPALCYAFSMSCLESFWCHIFHFLFQVCSSKAYSEFLDLRWKSTISKIHLREVGLQGRKCFQIAFISLTR